MKNGTSGRTTAVLRWFQLKQFVRGGKAQSPDPKCLPDSFAVELLVSHLLRLSRSRRLRSKYLLVGDQDGGEAEGHDQQGSDIAAHRANQAQHQVEEDQRQRLDAVSLEFMVKKFDWH